MILDTQLIINRQVFVLLYHLRPIMRRLQSSLCCRVRTAALLVTVLSTILTGVAFLTASVGLATKHKTIAILEETREDYFRSYKEGQIDQHDYE